MAAHPVANIWQGAFIDRMDYAYAAADLVLSRSGAGTVSELCLVAKPVLFVPSPNVAEDHQRHNAEALSTRGAAVMILDADAVGKLPSEISGLIADAPRRTALSREISKMALRNADERIVDKLAEITR